MSKKMSKYKVTGFAKFLIFMGISGVILFGGAKVADNLNLIDQDKSMSFHEVKETIKETIKQKIDEKKNKRESREENLSSTDNKLEERLLILIEENERLADGLEQCKNKQDSVAGGE